MKLNPDLVGTAEYKDEPNVVPGYPNELIRLADDPPKSSILTKK